MPRDFKTAGVLVGGCCHLQLRKDPSFLPMPCTACHGSHTSALQALQKILQLPGFDNPEDLAAAVLSNLICHWVWMYLPGRVGETERVWAGNCNRRFQKARGWMLRTSQSPAPTQHPSMYSGATPRNPCMENGPGDGSIGDIGSIGSMASRRHSLTRSVTGDG